MIGILTSSVLALQGGAGAPPPVGFITHIEPMAFECRLQQPEGASSTVVGRVEALTIDGTEVVSGGADLDFTQALGGKQRARVSVPVTAHGNRWYQLIFRMSSGNYRILNVHFFGQNMTGYAALTENVINEQPRSVRAMALGYCRFFDAPSGAVRP